MQTAMSLLNATSANLWSVNELAKLLDHETLTKKQALLMGSTIGQHIRHVLEFYECLLDTRDFGVVCYDKRKRRLELEEDIFVIGDTILRIVTTIESKISDTPIRLEISFSATNDEAAVFESTVNRELAYCLEHMIHHLVMIKMALSVDRPEIQLPENFGVAYSTIRNKVQCAQ